MSTFKLPDLGEGLAEAEILEWHVRPGDHVLVDRPLVSVETAKAVVEIPVPFSATVTALHVAVGDIVATGAPLVDFDSGTVVGSMPATLEEEFIDTGHVARAGRHAAGAAPAASWPGASATAPRALPVARAVAKHLGLNLADVPGSGPDGVIRLHDVLAQPRRRPPLRAHLPQPPARPPRRRPAPAPGPRA